METTFKLSPNLKKLDNAVLITEVGWEGISFLFYEKEERCISGLMQYHFPRHRTGEQIAELIAELFEKHSEYFKAVNEQVVFFNFRETELVPAVFQNDALRNEICDLALGIEVNCTYFTDNAGDIAINYRVQNDILNTIQRYFPSAKIYHSSLTLLKCIAKPQGNTLYCFIYNNQFKTALFKNGALQIVQYFSYNSSNDVAYHLLNIIRQYGLNEGEVALNLSGLVDKKSILFRDLDKFFSHIEFMAKPEGIQLSDKIEEHPEHFFSYLTNHVLCV